MRRPQGYSVVIDPDAPRTAEADTFTCAHCNTIVMVKPMCDPADMGGRCRVCDSLVCRRCHSTFRCDPFEEKLKRAEARDRALRSYGVA